MINIWQGEALKQLWLIPDQWCQCCVTSPPYWGLRDYGVDGQYGLEETPEAYVAKQVTVFREIKRVLRDDGTLWLNLGDSYAANGTRTNNNGTGTSTMGWPGQAKDTLNKAAGMRLPSVTHGLKPKDLIGIPWRIAFALQADGWYLRSDIIWHKPNPMPESVTDRPTKSHEYIFLLTKSDRYYYDAEAIRELPKPWILDRTDGMMSANKCDAQGIIGQPNRQTKFYAELKGANRRTVWTIATQPYKDAHFATFPEELPKLCILAGSKSGDTILDPFAGSGTVGKVALELGRKAILIELNEKYIGLAKERTLTTLGFNFDGPEPR
jgi:DNA modification methylase